MNVVELNTTFAGLWHFSKRIFESFTRGNCFHSWKNGFASGSKL